MRQRATVRSASILLFVLAAAACERRSPPPKVEVGPPPPTRTVVAVDTLHGDLVRDPYRWLEDQQAPDTRAWIAEQNAYTDSVMAQLPGKERLRQLATALLEIDVRGTPIERNGRYFYGERKADQDLFVYYWREGLDGEARVLIDPHGLSEDHTTSVRMLDVSRDGTWVVYGVQEGGVDEVEVRIRDVDSGEDLADVLPAARYGGVQLTPDRRGLYYSRFGTVEPRIYYHRIGSDPAGDRVVFGQGLSTAEIPFGELSPDGAWMLVTVIHGSSGPTALYLKNLASDGPWRTVIEDRKSRTFGGFAGDRLLLTTDLGAPNKRVVTALLSDPSVENWTEIVPERSDVVIEGASGVGGTYFVNYLQDVQPKLAQYDTTGMEIREIEFGTLGSVGGPRGEWEKDEAFVTFTSFAVPTTSWRLDTRTGDRTLWFRTEVPIDTSDFRVDQVWYESKDGTRVPMFLMYREGTPQDGTNPTLLTGYGGFNVSLTPGFSAQAAAWVELGGVFARPNLRGGGEFGEAWHQAGMLANKQNVFDDFVGAADFLVFENWTSPQHLAVEGGSNGGLLVGAAITQRPDLFGAAVIAYPLLDMLRYDRFMVAQFWVPEYGSASNPEQYEVLKAYSPYERAKTGADFPPTLLITGDGDTRVAPLHARKMTAMLQATNTGRGPILLRYHVKAGHSGGQPKTEQIDEMVEILAFMRWKVTGLKM